MRAYILVYEIYNLGLHRKGHIKILGYAGHDGAPAVYTRYAKFIGIGGVRFIQAVGAVNEKIEGFFDVCKGLGLSGAQGVIIPRPNACQLMLRADVVKAVEEGLFSVWVVDDVYDAMTILTGKTTAYINKQIRQRLHQYFDDSHKKPKN